MTGGAVTSLISFVHCLSYAALIFSGPLSLGLAQGISALLIGAAVTALGVAAFSVFRFAVSGPDGNACAVMASMAAAIAHDLSASATPAQAASNVLFVLAVTTFITGLVLAGLGTLRAGRWVRFIPYPVVGGLIAAAGMLTILGVARVVWPHVAGYSLQAALTEAAVRPHYLLALAWAVLMLIIMARVRGALVLPVTLLCGVMLFHATLYLAGISIPEAREAGWLFDAPPDATPWTPWSLSGFEQTEWLLLLGRLGDIGTLVLVTTLTLLINATGLEVETRRDADMDRELRLQGVANMTAALVGGFLGFLSMGRSLINYRLGATRRMSGVAFAVFTLLFAFFGMDVIGILPRPILGGTLLYFGMTLIAKWVFSSRRQLSVPDYVTLLLILVVTVVFGFGWGLTLGVLAGCVMFVVNYSRLRVIKFQFSGNEFRSSHERSAADKALLSQHGADIRIFVLQGFIFFGMADRLYRSVVDNALTRESASARWLLLDLTLVHGVDASALASFRKISYAARSAGAQLVVTGMRPVEAAEWKEGNDPDLSSIVHFSDIDTGVEWCEGQVLTTYRSGDAGSECDIRQWLGSEMGEAAIPLVNALVRRMLDIGEVLCRQNEPAEEMYFVESGRVAIELDLPEGKRRRLRTLGPGTVLGEMGLYRTTLRSANVVVLAPSVVFCLTAEALRRIEHDDPGVTSRFHAMVVRTVADRLEFSNALVAALQR